LVDVKYHVGQNQVASTARESTASDDDGDNEEQGPNRCREHCEDEACIPGGREDSAMSISLSKYKPSEKAPHSVEEQLKAVLDGIEDILVLLDEAGRILYVNKKTRDTSGHSQDQMSGEPLDALGMVPPQAMPRLFSLLNSVLCGQPAQPFRLDICARSGEAVPMEIHLAPLKNGEQIIGACFMARSTTDQKSESEAEPSGGDRFRNIVENSVDWLWEVNEKGVYTYVNARVRDILGYEPREVLGKTIFDLVPMKDVSRVTKTFATTMSARQPLKLVQMNNLRKDGGLVVLETTAAPILDAEGRLSGYQGIHRDITGREQKTDQRFAEDMVKLEKTVGGIIQGMTLLVEVRDPYTAGHQKRVAQLGCAIVKEMSDARTRVADLDRTIRVAGLLHDLGKIFIPIEILTKPGQLTQDEFVAIKNHPKAGYDILKNIEFPWPIADVVLQHHERMNGSGYPSGLKGDDIRPEARIVAVADVVEAMVYPRSYRPALGLDNALREIAKSKGTLYDADVVEACLSAFLDRGFKFQPE
jgi:PAS domain S-box-containing protein